MVEQSCKENGTKSGECVGIHNHRKEVAPNNQETRELVAPGIDGLQNFW